MTIQNTTWKVVDLISYIDSKMISKSKFQRLLKWLVQPAAGKSKQASMREFIDFLYTIQNTILPISFGEFVEHAIKMYINIDGNNRINAIYCFVKTPFVIYPEYMDDLTTFIGTISEITASDASKVVEFFKGLCYSKLFQYKKLKMLYANTEVEDIFYKITSENANTIDYYLEEIQKRLALPDGNSFESTVINVNIFYNATESELSKAFESMNRYGGNMSLNEIYASSLYDIIISIFDQNMNFEIRKEIKKYYDEKNANNEVLSGYTIHDINNFNMNAFDCIVGLQNYCNNAYKNAIIKFNPGDVPLFFKLYSLLYGEGVAAFNDVNINEFISLVTKTSFLLSSCMNEIFPSNIEEKWFNKKCQNKTLETGINNLYLIMTFIIGLIRTNIPDKKIIQSIKQIIVYHILVKEIKCASDKKHYEEYDNLKYQAGGAFVDNKSEKILKTPSTFLSEVIKDKLTEVLNIIIKETNSDISFSAKRSKNKRRKYSYMEKFLSAAYYSKMVSTFYLNNKYSTEHIIPFSSSWEGVDLDIDRVGNLIPMIAPMNSGRKNGHISYYQMKDSSFAALLKNVLPSNDTYNSIVQYVDKSVVIKDPRAYNKMCETNEKLYVDNFINMMFSDET
jgi:hypothetical protein